jgi:hypothetical protein
LLASQITALSVRSVSPLFAFTAPMKGATSSSQLGDYFAKSVVTRILGRA